MAIQDIAAAIEKYDSDATDNRVVKVEVLRSILKLIAAELQTEIDALDARVTTLEP